MPRDEPRDIVVGRPTQRGQRAVYSMSHVLGHFDSVLQTGIVDECGDDLTVICSKLRLSIDNEVSQTRVRSSCTHASFVVWALPICGKFSHRVALRTHERGCIAAEHPRAYDTESARTRARSTAMEAARLMRDEDTGKGYCPA